jgi:hypothetical protein
VGDGGSGTGRTIPACADDGRSCVRQVLQIDSAAWWVNRQLVEVDLGDGLQLLRGR